METTNNILKELELVAPQLAKMPRMLPYTAPDGYFDYLPNQILAKTKPNVYAVADDYFEQLSSSVMSKIKANETDELPTIFSQIKKEQVYKTPAGYLEKRFEIPEASIITMPKKRNTKRILMYAAAACILSFVSLSIFNFVQNKVGSGKQFVNNESLVITGTNVKYNEVKQINVEAAIDSLSDIEVDAYLCENGVIACAEPIEKVTSDLEKTDISEADLDAFIDGTE